MKLLLSLIIFPLNILASSYISSYIPSSYIPSSYIPSSYMPLITDIFFDDNDEILIIDNFKYTKSMSYTAKVKYDLAQSISISSCVPSYTRNYVPSYVPSYVPGSTRSHRNSYVPSSARSYVPISTRSHRNSYVPSNVPSHRPSNVPRISPYFLQTTNIQIRKEISKSSRLSKSPVISARTKPK